jgi:hypothetical protein
MSLSPIVLILLAACWTLPAALVAVAYFRQRAGLAEGTREVLEMDVVHRLRVASLDVDIRATEEREWWMVSPSERKTTAAASSVDRSVQDAAVITPYAEVSVTVSDSNGDECVRRCSVCLN